MSMLFDDPIDDGDQAIPEKPDGFIKDVNAASMVGVKAELARVKDQYQRAKLQANGATMIKSSFNKPALTKIIPVNKGVHDRSKRDVEQSSEDVKTLERAAKILAQKAELYNKLASGGAVLDDTRESQVLVDFEQKSTAKNTFKSKPATASVVAKIAFDEVEVHPAKSSEEEWVEYTDSLGRQRVCLRKDLPALREMDESVGATIPTIPTPAFPLDPQGKAPVAAVKKDTDPMHYQDVSKDEIRVMGAGYYAFSSDEGARAEQLNALNKLRTQTVEQRQRAEKLKQRRDTAKEDRLRKIKQRKLGIVDEGPTKDAKTAADLDSTEADDGAEVIPENLEQFLARVRQETV